MTVMTPYERTIMLSILVFLAFAFIVIYTILLHLELRSVEKAMAKMHMRTRLNHIANM